MLEKIDLAVESAINITNLQLKLENQIQHKDEQLLIKKGSNINSLGLAIFIATLEVELKKEANIDINLIEFLTSEEDIAFLESIGALKTYLREKE